MPNPAELSKISLSPLFGFIDLGHYAVVQDDAADWAGWTVTGVKTLLEAVYWTEPIDDEWSWCVECERLVQTDGLVDHVCSEHPDMAPDGC